jgi:DNA-directed RNA polymerase specialized sigma24 family protein
MATFSKQSPQWWDRELDDAGRAIREDVRAATHEVWKQACRRARSVLGDDADATTIMETCVERVSRYLDRKSVPLYSPGIAHLLSRAFSWAVQARRRRDQRIETVENLEKLVEQVAVPDWSNWSDAINRRLDLEKVLRRLSPRSCRILLLRSANRPWKEIAAELGLAESTAKNSFWREIRQVQLQLHIGREPPKRR